MIILMGLAGSGKSTQGKMLAEATDRVWLSVGQVLRDTGKFDEILERGELVDDMTVVKMMAEKMAEIVRGGKDAVLDGFPRDKEQAVWIAENIVDVIKLIVRIEVPKDELMQRLLARGRADDTREAIEERFRITEQNICSICKILGEKGVKIVQISGMGSPEEVFQRLLSEVEKMEQKNE